MYMHHLHRAILATRIVDLPLPFVFPIPIPSHPIPSFVSPLQEPSYSAPRRRRNNSLSEVPGPANLTPATDASATFTRPSRPHSLPLSNTAYRTRQPSLPSPPNRANGRQNRCIKLSENHPCPAERPCLAWRLARNFCVSRVLSTAA